MILKVLAWGVAFSCLADVTFDVRKERGDFGGFGTQIWAGDESVAPVLRDLNMNVVRMDIGKFKKKLDITGWGDAEFDAYYAKQKWRHHLKSVGLFPNPETKVVVNAFSPLRAWCMDEPKKNTLNPDFYAVYCKRMAAALASMKRAGVPVLGVEMFNEPDGDWDAYVAPESYNELVILLRTELDKRDLQDVVIVGPGLAHIDDHASKPWLDALSESGVAAMGAWSTHGYHWGKPGEQSPELLRKACSEFETCVKMKDPNLEKPILITEFSPLKVWANDANAIETDAFAARAVEDALSFLNGGARYILFWEAADMAWSRKRHHGLIRLDKSKRPCYLAFQGVFPYWQAGGTILQSEQGGGAIYGAALLDKESRHLVVSLVNSSAEMQTEKVQIKGVSSLKTQKIVRFSGGQLQEGGGLNVDSASFDVVLSAFSVESFVFGF